ncbi:3-deoxy-D-manno-octulosonic acid kinase [Candidatus Colwellia aromaticivorans]|uniref:3-deoxy-D-manno-octulosonic acid kinase n=1 Tax=Candidatus Colwellia aromaticivorans TaxID=2267621 RepID=UPI000DF17EDB|nr:3-deoxy-D-manno-octulosonic acid kinase [Candidatus Colwellia aromaticivorans]
MNNGLQIKTFQQGKSYCLYDSHEINSFVPNMLDVSYWQKKNTITGSAQGRGTTWFVKHSGKPSKQEKHWVLRHYYRGGLIGKIISDSYWFTSQKNTRAAREFDLLTYMQKLALPAPKPIACRVTRHGLFYSADLLSSRIEHAQDLVALLSKTTLSDALWKKIGITIKRFHDNNIYHHDLNAHNILIDKDDNVFLIDFDRGEVRKNDQASWQQANMARLQRSFLKEFNKLPTFHWQDDNWRLLLEGYLSH